MLAVTGVKIKQKALRVLVALAILLGVGVAFAGPAMASGAMRVDGNSYIGVWVETCGGVEKYIYPKQGNLCVKWVQPPAGMLMYYKWGYGTHIYSSAYRVYVGGSGITIWNVVRLA